MLTPFDTAAIAMLQYAGLYDHTKSPARDVMLLGDDLQAVADEFSEDATSEQEANHAVHVLVQRIGGYKNLDSYMRTLRASANQSKLKPESIPVDLTEETFERGPITIRKISSFNPVTGKTKKEAR
jgi:hypothetical protein